MIKFIEIPNKGIINIERIIYISNIDKYTNNKYFFEIYWHEAHYCRTFIFNTQEECENAYYIIKNALLENYNKMICD